MTQLAQPNTVNESWRRLRVAINEIAAEAGEWAGAPIPVSHAALVMEPRYPFAGVNGLKSEAADAAQVHDPVDDGYRIVNSWYSYHRGGTVHVIEHPDGHRSAWKVPERAGERLRFWIDTLGVAAQHAWDAEVEDRATEKLKSLVSAQAFHCYTLAGGFLETSKRSRVTYLFRKLRPTLALRPDRSGSMEVISILCLHPLGFYAGTWAGVMTPTDDVVAHLLLMRGDERRYWAKANHHEMWMASAGI